MRISEICRHSVVTCHRETSAVEVAQLMRDRHVGDVVVVENNDGRRIPVGIVTDRDLVVQVMAMGVSPDILLAGDLITGKLVTAVGSEFVDEAIRYMRSKGIRRLPVVDADNALIGVLTADDVTEYLAGELTDVTRIMPRQIQIEQAKRDPIAH
ncbi:MAG: CBS domain-containing protein [Pseudomonadota bacterium]